MDFLIEKVNKKYRVIYEEDRVGGTEVLECQFDSLKEAAKLAFMKKREYLKDDISRRNWKFECETDRTYFDIKRAFGENIMSYKKVCSLLSRGFRCYQIKGIAKNIFLGYEGPYIEKIKRWFI